MAPGYSPDPGPRDAGPGKWIVTFAQTVLATRGPAAARRRALPYLPSDDCYRIIYEEARLTLGGQIQDIDNIRQAAGRALGVASIALGASVGDCFVNAVIESLCVTMLVELLNRQRWRTRIGLANAIFDCLEIFHNRQRRHSRLGCTRSSNTRSCTTTTHPPPW